jgi:outer membrane protein assembly factor BamA
VDKQKPYRQNIVRNKFGFTNRFTEYTNGFLDWTLEAIGSETNDNYIGDTTDPEIQRQRRLLQHEQFNSILSFTIQRDKSNDIFSPSEGFIHSATFDEAGLFPLLIQGVFPNLPSTQFYRVSLIGRWYTEVSPHRYSILALKAKGGFEEKYGESRSDTSRAIPQTHRFYAGGGSSVRGWNSRDLIASGDPQYGGNLALEGSVELRTNILQGLHDGLFDKIWLVQFVDVGNVWAEASDFRFSEFAIAAGLGFRYDTFFGPFRIDWGFRVYNPAEAPGRQWITQRKLFGQTFKEGIFHFGIGHAF